MRKIEVQLAGVLRFELPNLELDDKEAVQAEMIEEQV